MDDHPPNAEAEQLFQTLLSGSGVQADMQTAMKAAERMAEWLAKSEVTERSRLQ